MPFSCISCIPEVDIVRRLSLEIFVRGSEHPLARKAMNSPLDVETSVMVYKEIPRPMSRYYLSFSFSMSFLDVLRISRFWHFSLVFAASFCSFIPLHPGLGVIEIRVTLFAKVFGFLKNE